ncbi:Ubiquitin carboxyl-terminal hydrolase 22 like protein [Argiope bruennichi]|uniref:Ubiquitin carboxyl-terminal hydrolase n=1 Tax=Argiope bruennichi TaxID=94029 RepID=A0A8T0FKQ4_ARGBR|nr:Ubiquitin carboxyl-terminal hydrolase 22 like protein [Argiope bruennichi]
MGTYSCPHLDELPKALKTYNVLLGYYVTCIAEKPPFQRLADDAYCRICYETNGKLHACLQCAFFGCLKSVDGNENHMKGHALKYKHYFAINLNHGAIFCFQCDDYKYNDKFEDSLTEFEIEARRLKITQAYISWKPNKVERTLVNGKIVKISDVSHFGLRGILNIGNSCYISCVVQVLMHTPVLIDFFLSDKHVCNLTDCCLLCELFMVFLEFYSGQSTPFDPASRFFPALQRFCRNSPGIEQQDCYELFQEILAGLHVNCPNNEDMMCGCMIRQMFYGIAQSCKECQRCHDSSSLPLDCFMDILLDVDRKDDCLVNVLNRKYLEPQLLSDYKCSNCEKTDTTYVHQRIKKLPNVVCFRMNCFLLQADRNVSRSRSRTMQKKSTAFAFEEFLNMSPYLSSESTNSSDRESACAAASAPYETIYQLFAVISHKGNLEGGHYVTYIRHRADNWYECDDRFVYKRSFEEVVGCDPFLLFYQNYPSINK